MDKSLLGWLSAGVLMNSSIKGQRKCRGGHVDTKPSTYHGLRIDPNSGKNSVFWQKIWDRGRRKPGAARSEGDSSSVALKNPLEKPRDPPTTRGSFGAPHLALLPSFVCSPRHLQQPPKQASEATCSANPATMIWIPFCTCKCGAPLGAAMPPPAACNVREKMSKTMNTTT